MTKISIQSAMKIELSASQGADFTMLMVELSNSRKRAGFIRQPHITEDQSDLIEDIVDMLESLNLVKKEDREILVMSDDAQRWSNDGGY